MKEIEADKGFMFSISPILPPSELPDAEGLMAEGYQAMAEENLEIAREATESTRKERQDELRRT